MRLQARARAPFRGLLLGVKAGVRGVCGADSMRPRFDGVGFGGGEFSCDFDSSSCARERDAYQWLLRLLCVLARFAALTCDSASDCPDRHDSSPSRRARLDLRRTRRAWRSGLKEVTRPSVSSASRTS